MLKVLKAAKALPVCIFVNFLNNFFIGAVVLVFEKLKAQYQVNGFALKATLDVARPKCFASFIRFDEPGGAISSWLGFRRTAKSSTYIYSCPFSPLNVIQDIYIAKQVKSGKCIFSLCLNFSKSNTVCTCICAHLIQDRIIRYGLSMLKYGIIMG
jgi:hypothetical protein